MAHPGERADVPIIHECVISAPQVMNANDLHNEEQRSVVCYDIEHISEDSCLLVCLSLCTVYVCVMHNECEGMCVCVYCVCVCVCVYCVYVYCVCALCVCVCTACVCVCVRVCVDHSPAMACGSAEYSWTSITPQSREALSFFSLEAEGATLNRPWKATAGDPVRRGRAIPQTISVSHVTGCQPDGHFVEIMKTYILISNSLWIFPGDVYV